MTDTIASRVTRVIGGSVHALLDAMENAAPEATMAQAIREVDQAIDEVRSELGRVEAVKHVASSSLNKLNTEKETLGEQIDIAMAKGDETLARAGIAKQIDIDDQIPVLQRSLQDSVGRGNELEGYIAALAGQEARDGIGAAGLHRGAGGRVRARPARTHRAAPRRERSTAPDRPSIGCSRARPASRSRVRAINPDAAKLRELQDMARTHRIDERLAALKATQSNRR